MALRQRRYEFDAEISRIEDRQDELATEAAGLDRDNPAFAQKRQRGHTLDSHLSGLRWARDEAHEDDSVTHWDEEVDGVELGGLTGGEFGMVQDAVQDAAAGTEHNVGDGARRIHNVAAGTVDAPYHDPKLSHQEMVARVGNLPIAYLMWANERVDELTSVEGNGQRGFDSLLLDKRAESQTED